MGCEEMKTSTSFSNVTVVKKSKGNIFTEKPIFWDKGNSLIVSSGQSLHMYSTSTGNHLKELFQCPDNIISYQLHPLHDSQLIVTSENGELIVFNLKSNEIEYSLKLKLNQKFLKKQKAPKFNVKGEKGDENFDWEKQSLDSLSERKFLHANVRPFLGNPLEIFVWASWCLNDELQCHVSAFTFNKGKHIRLIQIQKSGLRKCNLNFVLGTVQQYEVFVGMSTYYVHITRYDAQKHPFSIRHYIGHEKKVTCLAFHPEECSFATGDSYGRIIIWKNIFENQPLKEILHWHTLPVHDLFFSRFGNYLFSGGEENVLVKWALNSSGKDFLPRLSSTIHHIIGDYESSLLSVSTMDNRILIVDFNFQNVSAVQHFSKWSLLRGEHKLNVFTVDPKNSCLVLNGKTGHIQFLSLNEDGKFIYTFDVTNRNFITDADSIIINTEVTHAKFSKSGRWLITAESRTEGLCKESRLKFWLFCEKQNSFMLNTNVEFPHEEFGICSLEVSADDVVATTGGDKKFRLWSAFESNQVYRKKEFWALHSVKKYRSLTCCGTDFSKDASLIAVTFGPVVTVWETESCELKCSLSIPYRKDVLKFCKFGNHELSYLLVTGSEFYISSWDVITLSVKWTVPLKLSLLISDPFTTYMIAFTKKDSSLIIFNPSSPTPYLIIKKVSDFPVVAAQCVQPETGKIGLYFLTSDQELYCLENEEKSYANISNDSVQTFSTPYALQLAEKQNQAEVSERKTVLLNKNNKQTGFFLLDSPSHTLPNPSLICSDILKGLLLFSKNHSAGTSFVKEVKEENVRIIKNSENSDGFDSVKLESKLLDVVKTIFL